ncbi:hypothetical protein HOF92_15150 [bacterium]|nr:hypothetical protein [bacterium]
MAIEWIEEIPRIRRILAEAETSSRLLAIRSLELLLTQEALELLEEYHASAISFEKYFMDKAIAHIKSFQETGNIPPAIEKARERAKSLKEVSESTSIDSQPHEEVSLEDVADTLKKQTSQPSKTVTEKVETRSAIVEEEVSSIPEEVLTAVESPLVPETALPGSDSPSVDSSFPLEQLTEESDLSPGQSSSMEQSVNDYSDLLPAMSEEVGHAVTGDSHPSLEPDASGIMDSQSIDAGSYDDLLPPMAAETGGELALNLSDPAPAANEVHESQASDFEDLLPANDGVGVGFIPPAEGFDDLLPAMGEPDSHDDLLPNIGGADSAGGDYDDLLPPLENSEGGAQDYDDLLPPLQDSGSLDTYDDLFPPLQDSSAGAGDYDDLLPPLQGGSPTDGYDDLLPPMRSGDDSEPQPMGGGGMDLDDLLPPMKPEGEGPEGSI